MKKEVLNYSISVSLTSRAIGCELMVLELLQQISPVGFV
jgi:hypothetical protein